MIAWLPASGRRYALCDDGYCYCTRVMSRPAYECFLLNEEVIIYRKLEENGYICNIKQIKRLLNGRVYACEKAWIQIQATSTSKRQRVLFEE